MLLLVALLLSSAAGDAGIAFDNLELSNESGRCGHFDASGHWVQQFTGHGGDPAFTQSVLEWTAIMRAQVHAYSPTATATIAVTMALTE